MEQVQTPPSAGIVFKIAAASSVMVEVSLAGRLDTQTTGKVWKEIFGLLDTHQPRELVINVSALDYCDGAGVCLLIALEERQTSSDRGCHINGLADGIKRMKEIFQKTHAGDVGEKRGHVNFFVKIGEATCQLCQDLANLIVFTGELTVTLIDVIFKRGKLRWKDIWHFVEIGGVDAMPIVILLNFLMGLIMAFQSAIPMKQFGADIFIADLVGLAITRELGPLMTAVILTGRTGSAYAAELGTMKVNQELDALNTMGLDPMKFLAMNRIIAVLILMPALTLIGEFAGLFGGGVVFTSLGYPLVTYINKLGDAISLKYFFGGFVKCFVFGLLVAAIGCLRGFQTKQGASAVGTSTTRAVVSGLTLIILADGVFSIMYYFLGI
jgi:phospholipid/cholesterol/gamma-HCH transport system permease protein